MYDESKLQEIMLEMHDLIEIHDIIGNDHPKERAIIEICNKYKMIAIAIKNDGSEILVAEENSKVGIGIETFDNIATGMGIDLVPENLWGVYREEPNTFRRYM